MSEKKTMDCPSCGKSILYDDLLCNHCSTYIIRKYYCVFRDIESVESIRKLKPVERNFALIHIWFRDILKELPPACPALALAGEEYRASLITTLYDRELYLVVDTGADLFVGRIKDRDDTICYSVPPDVIDDVRRRLAHELCLPSDAWGRLDWTKARIPGRQIEVLMNPGRRWSKPPLIIQMLCPECGSMDVKVYEERWDPVTQRRVERRFWNRSQWERAEPFYGYKCQFCGYFWIWLPGTPKPKMSSREEMIKRRGEILEGRKRRTREQQQQQAAWLLSQKLSRKK